MTKDRIFKKEYAPELFRIALNDLVAAETLAKNPEVRRETVFFQAQQSLEKALKALLCFHEKSVPMTHDLSLLIERLGEALTPKLSLDLVDLTDFASIRRYEEGKFIISNEELVATLKTIKSVLNTIKVTMKLK